MLLQYTLLSQELHKVIALLIFGTLYTVALHLTLKMKSHSLRDQKLKFNHEVSIPIAIRAIYVMLFGWYGYAVGEWGPIYLTLGTTLGITIWIICTLIPEELWKQGSENNKGELLISVPLVVFFLLLVIYILGKYEG